jgi:3-deoxy-D-manno-octulosonic-acid transferase
MAWALRLYALATGLAAPFAPALLATRARRGKEDSARLAERLGRTRLSRPEGTLIWLHGASVGETLSILPLIPALRLAAPDISILVTSGTVTSADLLRRRLPIGVPHQYLPVDTPQAALAFAEHWRPDLAVFVESEIWPNLLLAIRRTGARTALISARLSEGSRRGWGRIAAAASALFSRFDLVMAQDDEMAQALTRLGARDDGRLNLKLIGEPLPVDAAALRLAQAALGTRTLLLAASTHPGEEEQVLNVFRWLKDRPEAPLLVLVPRHPARGAALAALVVAEGFRMGRRSLGQAPSGELDVYVADTLGELGLWFRLARLALIGGSMVAGVGGHNPLEASRLGCPVVSGTYIENWRGVYSGLVEVGGVRIVEGEAALAGAFADALTDPAALRAEAGRAQVYAAGFDGVIEGVCTRLIRLADTL